MILALKDEEIINFESEKKFNVLYLGRWIETFRADFVVNFFADKKIFDYLKL